MPETPTEPQANPESVEPAESPEAASNEVIEVQRSGDAHYEVEILDKTTGQVRQTRLRTGSSDRSEILRPTSIEEFQDDYITEVPADVDPVKFMHAWMVRRRFNNPGQVAAADILAAQFTLTTPEDRAAAADLYAAQPF